MRSSLDIQAKEKNLFSAKHYKVKVVKKKQNPIQYVLGVLSYALFILLFLIGIILLIYVADIKIREAKGDTTPPMFNAYVVLTGSMKPNIDVNDVVITKKKGEGTLKIGDVITFVSADPRYSGVIITHRIVDVILENGVYFYRTKGDNNDSVDMTLTSHSNVVGKVFMTVPYLGYVQSFLATSRGWIIVILIPWLIVIAYDIMKLFKIFGKKVKK
ncbi:MAG: signal peptidase I [bacterium]|nr:signal peptidase I [bacterium]